MRLEEKYPDVAMDQDVPESCLWHSGVIGKCFVCDARTSLIDLCFESHLCSEECAAAAIEDIARRMQQDAEDRYKPSF